MKSFIAIFFLSVPVFAQHGLSGEYFNGKNFEKKVHSRTDVQVHFDWRGKKPGPGVNESFYSVRWKGKLLAPNSGEYTFSAKVDDGIRLWVGDKLVLNNWKLNDFGSADGKVALQAGKYYNLKVEYFNDMLEGEVHLYWQTPDAKQPVLVPWQVFFLKEPAPKDPPLVATVKSSPPTKPKVSSPPPVVVQKPQVVPPTVQANPPVVVPESKKASVVKGERIILENVTFEQSSFILKKSSYPELDRWAGILLADLTLNVEISGHTEALGDPQLNKNLSEQRATVVATYLARKGVAESRLATRGYGSSRPLPNATDGSQNRRVEVFVKP